MFFLIFVFIAITKANILVNGDFSQPLSNGWSIGESHPVAKIVANYVQLGNIGETESTGNSSIFQDFVLSSCNQKLSFDYQPFTADNNFNNDFQAVIFSDPSSPTSGEVAIPFKTLLGFNALTSSLWMYFQCNVCDGSCGGVNLQPYFGSVLRITLVVHQNGNGKETGIKFTNVSIVYL